MTDNSVHPPNAAMPLWNIAHFENVVKSRRGRHAVRPFGKLRAHRRSARVFERALMEEGPGRDSGVTARAFKVLKGPQILGI